MRCWSFSLNLLKKNNFFLRLIRKIDSPKIQFNLNRSTAVVEIVGPPCSGKTTLLHELKASLGLKYYYDSDFFKVSNADVPVSIVSESYNKLFFQELDYAYRNVKETDVLIRSSIFRSKIMLSDFILSTCYCEKPFLISEGMIHSFSNAIYASLINDNYDAIKIFSNRKVIFIDVARDVIKSNLSKRLSSSSVSGYTYDSLTGAFLDDKIDAAIKKYSSIVECIEKFGGDVFFYKSDSDIELLKKFIGS